MQRWPGGNGKESIMKTNESKLQKFHAALLRRCHAAWMPLHNWLYRQPRSDDVKPNATPTEPPTPRLNPLERITEHLRRLGLGQQVHVRFEAGGGDFVLEDADGFVHAKDYAEAVVLIERIWLYQP